MAQVRLNVSDVYEYGNISFNNVEAWKDIYKMVRKALNDGVKNLCLDFGEIEIDQPWMSVVFAKTLKCMSQECDNVEVKVQSNEVIEGLSVLCIVEGFTNIKLTDTCVYREVAVETEVDNSLIEMIGSCVTVEDDLITIALSDVISSISKSITVDALNEVIRININESDATKILIDLNVSVHNQIMKKLSDMISSYENDGFTVVIDTDDEDIAQRIGMYKMLMLNEMGESEREGFIRKKLKKGTVGMLVRYMQTIRRDDLGRSGDGHVLWSRLAIYKGMTKDKQLVFKVFPQQNFYGKCELECLGAGDKFTAKEERVRLSDIGVTVDGKLLIGRHYHFEMPVQEDPKYNVTVRVMGENGIESKEFIFPEFIKSVLDEYKEKYNEELLEEVIKESKRLMSEYIEVKNI